jgi:hypothetical protein
MIITTGTGKSDDDFTVTKYCPVSHVQLKVPVTSLIGTVRLLLPQTPVRVYTDKNTKPQN